MENRTTKAGKNIIFSTFFQIIKLVLAFVIRILFVRKLGASYLGVNGLFSNILSIFSLADMGITTAMMYSLYKPIAENDWKKISKYINYFSKIYRIIAISISIIGILFIPFIPLIVNLPSNMPNIYLYYAILLINSVLSYLFIYKTTLLMADQKMYIINKFDIIFYILLFVLQLFVIAFTNNFTLYLLCNVLCTFLGNVCKVRTTNKIYPYLKIKDKNNELTKNEKKELFSNVKSLFYYKIGGIIQSNTDNILISIFAGTIIVGYYSNYTMIILQCTSFITLIFTSLKSSVGNYLVEKNSESRLKIFNIMEVVNYILVGGMSILFYTLIPTFIEIAFGKEYVLSKILLLFLVLNFYTSNIRQTIWTFRESSGLFNKTKYITLVTSMFNLVFSIVFGYLWGIIGIISATVLARMLYAWWKEPTILYSEVFNDNPKTYFKNYIIRIILTIALMILLDFVFSLIVIDSLIIYLLFKIVIACVIIIIIYYVLFKKSEAYDFFINKIKVMKGKKNE